MIASPTPYSYATAAPFLIRILYNCMLILVWYTFSVLCMFTFSVCSCSTYNLYFKYLMSHAVLYPSWPATWEKLGCVENFLVLSGLGRLCQIYPMFKIIIWNRPKLVHVHDILTVLYKATHCFSAGWPAWLSGRTSVSGQRSFAVLRSTCSWWVTTYVGKSSATGQPTRPTQPFILSGSINEYWAVIRCSPPHSVEAPSGERLRGKGRHGVICR